MKDIAKLVAFAAVWAIAWAAKESFNLPDYSIWIATLAVVVVMMSFNYESRLQALEAKVVPDEYRETRAAMHGERHVPKHRQPATLIEGGAIASWINEAHEIHFDDFRWFGALLNLRLSHPWSVEELPETNLRGYDGPEIGRRYQVWFNACKIGTIQVKVGSFSALDPEKFADNRKARAELKLHFLRFVPYDDAYNLLYQLGLYIRSFDHQDIEGSHSAAKTEAVHALTAHLWDVVREPEYEETFEFIVEGSYDVFQDQVRHWKSTSFDPMEKWGGDRPNDD